MSWHRRPCLLLFLVVSRFPATHQDVPENEHCEVSGRGVGVCVRLSQCPELRSILADPHRSRADFDYAVRSRCGTADDQQPLVCCAVRNILPTDCGQYVPQTGDRIFNRQVGLEFPWMALLEYRTPMGAIRVVCGGFLINNRYVLTAAQCLAASPSIWRLESVRLGEYDCVSDGTAGRVCSNKPAVVPVEEQIVHEDYRLGSLDQRHDVALVRMGRNAQFTKYILPACLPRSDGPGLKRLAVTWGKTDGMSESEVRRRIDLPLFGKSYCEEIYKRNASVNLEEVQICEGGESSCRADSNGLLMQLEWDPAQGREKWVTVGLVSFGPKRCGSSGWDEAYVRVLDYVPWILGKLRL